MRLIQGHTMSQCPVQGCRLEMASHTARDTWLLCPCGNSELPHALADYKVPWHITRQDSLGRLAKRLVVLIPLQGYQLPVCGIRAEVNGSLSGEHWDKTILHWIQ